MFRMVVSCLFESFTIVLTSLVVLSCVLFGSLCIDFIWVSAGYFV